MKTHSRYKLLLILPVLFALACSQKMNKRVTLWRNDRIPYGTYYTFQSLQNFFPEASIKTWNRPPNELDMDSGSVFIVITPSVLPTTAELNSMLNMVYSGSHVFISALGIAENILDSMSFKMGPSDWLSRIDSFSVNILDPASGVQEKFSYPGFRLAGYFAEMDSTISYVIGTDTSGRANFVRIFFQSGGSFSLHSAPAAFTNFFLLHKNNKQYLDLAFSQLPEGAPAVIWDEYFRHHSFGRPNNSRSGFSKLEEILGNEVLRWAFWLTVILFAVIYFFESKRKQRMVPVIPKNRNSSLDFVKTIGRLYYQRKDNKNLAAKIITHFLSYVRSTYNIQTAQLDQAFVKKLSMRSGYPIEKIEEITNSIRAVEEQNTLNDEDLLAFNNKIENFYQHV